MQAAVASNPELVTGGPDLDIRRGYDASEERQVISYDQYQAIPAGPDRPRAVRRYAVLMRAPKMDKKGRLLEAGGGEAVAMPAEKFQKWFGQHYRPTKSLDDLSLYEFPEPPAPTRWLPSMIDDAIAEGKPIPREMRPAGYMGPVFDLDAPPTVAAPVADDIHRCTADDCKRFFDSAQGLAVHVRNEHKES